MQENAKLKRLVEASLFMAPGAMGLRDLAKTAHTTVPEIRVALNTLIHDYAERDSALEIREDQAGFRMAVRRKLEDDVAHLAASPEMHKGVMKTLAYIAYKQPIKQSDVIKYRNTKAYDHVAVLEEKGYITKQRAGITYTIRTTKRFHQDFGSRAKAVAEPEKQATAERQPEPPKTST